MYILPNEQQEKERLRIREFAEEIIAIFCTSREQEDDGSVL